MSPSKDSERGAGTTRNGRGRSGEEDPGILAQLPRTRPQRSSRHRATARDDGVAESVSTATAGTVNGAAPAAEKTRGARTAKKASPTSRSKAARPTAKHGAAGSAAAAGGGAGASTKAPSRGSSAKRRTRTSAASSTAAPSTTSTAPKQGFESEGERASGPVHPPGGAELVASAAEIVGELAKAGLSTGERLLKDVLSRLPL
jgi:hypothetical protein